MSRVHVHKWEERVGRPPYRFVTVISLPAAPTDAARAGGYTNAMAQACKQASAYGIGLGTCDVCGMGILHNYVCRTADGTYFVVGSDCVAHLGDSALVTAVEAAERKRKRTLARARADAKREAWRLKAETEVQAQRERNGGLTDYEVAEQKREHDQAAREREITMANQWLITALEGARDSNFASSMRVTLTRQHLADLSDRCVDILRDIYGKAAGRRGSKNYKAAVEDFEQRTGL